MIFCSCKYRFSSPRSRSRSSLGLPPVIYERRHLEAVVKSFDPGQRGWLSPGQVKRAFITLGLPPREITEEKLPTEEVLNELEAVQERELYHLVTAGSDREEESSSITASSSQTRTYGICIHLCFLFSIFDIYFKSPIVKHVSPFKPTHEAVADRLVLFVVDGLRAESFVNYTTMPYLRSRANSNGRWGISHTRVPTESRPGHVAVIAGFYEDPSAIAKGWKENPVDFDSVFNQTTYTWCWGTYDIIDIFTKGSIDNHIFVKKFDPYDQNFSTDKNTTLLDDWVFQNVKEFFNSAKYDNSVMEKLKGKKIAFFLHLLGTDTSGHTHKPKTQNFLTTLRFVDEGIQEIEQVIRDFYEDDGKTTFLMTSDHGMTDWGSHGAGDDHETQTPYVIWGAGVKQATQGQIDPNSNKMSLEHRLDITQADLAPLMSTILSIPVPVNSIGQLTTDLLDMSLENRAKAVYSNSRQLASQYDKKRADIEAYVIPLLYQPFEPFTKRKYNQLIEFTEKLLLNEEYEKLILFSEEIMDLSLSGLTYYHNYYQRPLLVLVTLSFIGWIVCLLKALSEQNIDAQAEHSNTNKDIIINRNLTYNYVNILFLILFVISNLLVYVQNLPVQYYLYLLLPICMWWYALSSPGTWAQTFRQLRMNQSAFTMVMEVFCYSTGSLALGLSFTYRWMLSIPLLGMGLWPFLSSTRAHLTKPILVAWPTTCLLLCLFSFMPVVGKEVFIQLVVTAGVIWLFVIALYLQRVLLSLFRNNTENKREIVLTVVQMILLILSLQNIYVQSRRFEQGTPVSYVYQTMAWGIAGASFILPLVHSRRLMCRLLAVNTSLLNFYILLSVAHEGLFMVTLMFNVTCWIYIEFKLLHLKNVKITECSFDKDTFRETSKSFTTIERSISNQDFRRAFFFITYIILAFFGTGNIASLNSFEVRWVTCFITSFQPFVITGLILLKTLSPFLSVACALRAVQHLTKAPVGYLNMIVLIYSNIMGIQLLYNVKNTGSWLEIGTSISQFVIVQVITLFIVLINQIARLLTDVSIYSIANNIFRTRKKYV
ncbi:GPI ethanolamine phosphate transferase 1-like isoform X3 [Pectinophora gossypiella]|uniref:GPI ethanolamine phosphate transferase 1-like isoform X3 n=1 Tax=Pectinophora gossypiella TaxID=13191 RepID=UPI00214EFA91|nr:GPI ethanolamine phosphate transferase 1-like isoform X3 [Pectinophora gossypiella]